MWIILRIWGEYFSEITKSLDVFAENYYFHGQLVTKEVPSLKVMVIFISD